MNSKFIIGMIPIWIIIISFIIMGHNFVDDRYMCDKINEGYITSKEICETNHKYNKANITTVLSIGGVFFSMVLWIFTAEPKPELRGKAPV